MMATAAPADEIATFLSSNVFQEWKDSMQTCCTAFLAEVGAGTRNLEDVQRVIIERQLPSMIDRIQTKCRSDVNVLELPAGRHMTAGAEAAAPLTANAADISALSSKESLYGALVFSGHSAGTVLARVMAAQPPSKGLLEADPIILGLCLDEFLLSKGLFLPLGRVLHVMSSLCRHFGWLSAFLPACLGCQRDKDAGSLLFDFLLLKTVSCLVHNLSAGFLQDPDADLVVDFCFHHIRYEYASICLGTVANTSVTKFRRVSERFLAEAASRRMEVVRALRYLSIHRFDDAVFTEFMEKLFPLFASSKKLELKHMYCEGLACVLSPYAVAVEMQSSSSGSASSASSLAAAASSLSASAGDKPGSVLVAASPYSAGFGVHGSSMPQSSSMLSSGGQDHSTGHVGHVSSLSAAIANAAISLSGGTMDESAVATLLMPFVLKVEKWNRKSKHQQPCTTLLVVLYRCLRNRYPDIVKLCIQSRRISEDILLAPADLPPVARAVAVSPRTVVYFANLSLDFAVMKIILPNIHTEAGVQSLVALLRRKRDELVAYFSSLQKPIITLLSNRQFLHACLEACILMFPNFRIPSQCLIGLLEYSRSSAAQRSGFDLEDLLWSYIGDMDNPYLEVVMFALHSMQPELIFRSIEAVRKCLPHLSEPQVEQLECLAVVLWADPNPRIRLSAWSFVHALGTASRSDSDFPRVAQVLSEFLPDMQALVLADSPAEWRKSLGRASTVIASFLPKIAQGIVKLLVEQQKAFVVVSTSSAGQPFGSSEEVERSVFMAVLLCCCGYVPEDFYSKEAVLVRYLPALGYISDPVKVEDCIGRIQHMRIPPRNRLSILCELFAAWQACPEKPRLSFALHAVGHIDEAFSEERDADRRGRMKVLCAGVVEDIANRWVREGGAQKPGAGGGVGAPSDRKPVRTEQVTELLSAMLDWLPSSGIVVGSGDWSLCHAVLRAVAALLRVCPLPLGGVVDRCFAVIAASLSSKESVAGGASSGASNTRREWEEALRWRCSVISALLSQTPSKIPFVIDRAYEAPHADHPSSCYYASLAMLSVEHVEPYLIPLVCLGLYSVGFRGSGDLLLHVLQGYHELADAKPSSVPVEALGAGGAADPSMLRENGLPAGAAASLSRWNLTVSFSCGRLSSSHLETAVLSSTELACDGRLHSLAVLFELFRRLAAHTKKVIFPLMVPWLSSVDLRDAAVSRPLLTELFAVACSKHADACHGIWQSLCMSNERMMHHFPVIADFLLSVLEGSNLPEEDKEDAQKEEEAKKQKKKSQDQDEQENTSTATSAAAAGADGSVCCVGSASEAGGADGETAKIVLSPTTCNAVQAMVIELSHLDLQFVLATLVSRLEAGHDYAVMMLSELMYTTHDLRTLDPFLPTVVPLCLFLSSSSCAFVREHARLSIFHLLGSSVPKFLFLQPRFQDAVGSTVLTETDIVHADRYELLARLSAACWPDRTVDGPGAVRCSDSESAGSRPLSEARALPSMTPLLPPLSRSDFVGHLGDLLQCLADFPLRLAEKMMSLCLAADRNPRSVAADRCLQFLDMFQGLARRRLVVPSHSLIRRLFEVASCWGRPPIDMATVNSLISLVNLMDASKLILFPEIWWAAVVFMKCADDAVFHAALQLLQAMLTKLDFDSPMTQSVLLAAVPAEWKFTGLAPLLLRSMGLTRTSTLGFQVTGEIMGIACSSILDPTGTFEKRLVLAMLPLICSRVFPPTPIAGPKDSGFLPSPVRGAQAEQLSHSWSSSRVPSSLSDAVQSLDGPGLSEEDLQPYAKNVVGVQGDAFAAAGRVSHFLSTIGEERLSRVLGRLGANVYISQDLFLADVRKPLVDFLLARRKAVNPGYPQAILVDGGVQQLDGRMSRTADRQDGESRRLEEEAVEIPYPDEGKNDVNNGVNDGGDVDDDNRDDADADEVLLHGRRSGSGLRPRETPGLARTETGGLSAGLETVSLLRIAPAVVQSLVGTVDDSERIGITLELLCSFLGSSFGSAVRRQTFIFLRMILLSVDLSGVDSIRSILNAVAGFINTPFHPESERVLDAAGHNLSRVLRAMGGRIRSDGPCPAKDLSIRMQTMENPFLNAGSAEEVATWLRSLMLHCDRASKERAGESESSLSSSSSIQP